MILPKTIKIHQKYIFPLHFILFYYLSFYIPQDVPKKNMYNSIPLFSGPQTSLDVMFIINFIGIICDYCFVISEKAES